MAQIQKADILQIEKDLKVELTDSELNWILDNYDDYQSDNFDSTWVEIVEVMIYQVINNRDF